MEWLKISLVGLQAGSQKTAEIRLFPLVMEWQSIRMMGSHFISFWRFFDEEIKTVNDKRGRWAYPGNWAS